MRIAIFGYGGHAKEVYHSLSLHQKSECEFFVDDNYTNEFTKPISEFDPESYSMIVAVANSQERKKIVERLPKNTKYFTFIHPTAQIIDPDVEIGEGSYIGVNSIITTNIKIGKHSILNRGNQVGHDSIIGDYFSAMPGAIVSGNVVIGESVYMGNNSSIREKITICDNVTIGLNSGVVKNINEPGVYVGLPVKKIK